MDEKTLLIVLTVICAACAVVCLATVLAPRLQKKPDLGSFLGLAAKGMAGADKLTDALRVVFPGFLPLTIADKVIDYAKLGVEKAEQLYRTESIGKDKRKESATEFVEQALDLAQVEVTPQIRQLIDQSIEAAVFALKHAGETTDG